MSEEKYYCSNCRQPVMFGEGWVCTADCYLAWFGRHFGHLLRGSR